MTKCEYQWLNHVAPSHTYHVVSRRWSSHMSHWCWAIRFTGYVTSRQACFLLIIGVACSWVAGSRRILKKQKILKDRLAGQGYFCLSGQYTIWQASLVTLHASITAGKKTLLTSAYLSGNRTEKTQMFELKCKTLTQGSRTIVSTSGGAVAPGWKGGGG